MLASRHSLLTIAAVSALALPAPAQADGNPPAPDATLPIKEITLYRSGVGYFERDGLIDGNATVQLRFNTDQINDILKSMVLLDLDGGTIEAASYSSKEPLARRLASFAVDISDNPTTAELLNRLRGTRVTVHTLEGPTRGTVMGVETRTVTADAATVQHPFVNLLTDNGIKSIDLATATGFEILDEQLASELSKALAALAEHRADRTKTVDLSFKGEGARRIVVAYIHEMPVWKTSYRLVLSDSGEPTLQGWAIVENTTDEDWNSVALSLVAGQPVGFQMDLYQPLFLTRPTVPVPVIAGVAPRTYEGEVVDLDTMQPAERPSSLAFKVAEDTERRARSGRMPFSGKAAGYAVSDMAEYAARASASDVGEVFQYSLDEPVTIERRRSAMLPILSAAVQGRRVSIYNIADGLDHPMRGVDMTNTSGLQLMPGPISVFDQSAYAGDARIAHVSAGEERLLAYAVDLEVLASTDVRSDSEAVSLRIVDGMIEQTRTSRQTTRYTFKNNDDKRDRTIIIEHARQGGWELVQPAEPVSQTPTAYRFEAHADKSAAAGLEVVLERTDRSSVAVTSFDMPTLVAYARSGKVSDAVVAAVRKAADLQAAVHAVDQQISSLEQERSAITADQSRIRENMGRIDRTTDLYARYIKKLNEQETRLEDMVDQLEQLHADRDARQQALDAYVRTLNVS